jgi:hypothetical protein
MRYLMFLIIFSGLALAAAPKGAVKTFAVKDYLGHAWRDEVVTFPFSVKAGAYMLTDEAGNPVPAQFSGITKANGMISGSVSTLVTVEPDKTVERYLCPAAGKKPASSLALTDVKGVITLNNDRLGIILPHLPGKLAQPAPLATLPAPFGTMTAGNSGAMGQSAWSGAEGALVSEATTEILARGQILLTVAQTYRFTDGSAYKVTIQLGELQDAILITEDYSNSTVKCALLYDMSAGVRPSKLLWNNQWKETANGKSWAKTITDLTAAPDGTICNLRPWSFWWLGDLTMWAGAYAENGYLLGFMATHPSRWTPSDWDGFDKTQCPISKKDGRLLASLPLFTRTTKEGVVQPLHREWALTLGKTADHAVDTNVPTLRRQLIKYSEFPLNEVKDFGFDYTPSPKVPTEHPYLICTRKDIERVRKQTEANPLLKAQVDEDYKYIMDACHSMPVYEKSGWEGYYRQCYIGNGQQEKLPECYIGKDDPNLGKLLAAAVKGMATELSDLLLENPSRPAIGSHGPWFSAQPMKLLLNYDLIAGTGVLTQEEETRVRAFIVLSAHFLAHPDYWNTDVGLCSANPNMTSSIYLPRGMVGLYLDGHPKAAGWVTHAEAELKSELQHWIADGGAWIEDPGYQSASLDGIFLLAAAMKNVRGTNYFADPKFKETMYYYGFLLTPPDKRFPPQNPKNLPAPMVLPSIGDMFSGYMTLYNGWMAKATADSDPTYSKMQQYFWKKQNYYLGMAGRAAGFSLAMTDAELPDAPPALVAAQFPGFGNVMRTSWTDPLATYVAHRTGHFNHHYHAEYNEIVLNAKGAPLCTDFGNCYAPLQRAEPYYHSTVSYDKPDSPRKWGNAGKWSAFASLPKTLDYSSGESYASGNQRTFRHLLLVKSDDPLGANYLVVRDITQDGQPNQQFYYNLWCLATGVQTAGNTAHFTGQHGVDLDLYVLSPENPAFEKDQWGFKQQIYVWGWFEENQLGVRVQKSGSRDDFITVLYPRALGQGPAQTALLSPTALAVKHMEGTDYLILSPGKPTELLQNGVSLSGEIAYARLYDNGAIRLAVLQGKGQAEAGGYLLSAAIPASLEIAAAGLTGESSAAGTVTITLPADAFAAFAAFQKAGKVVLDGKTALKVTANADARTISFDVPAGMHRFAIIMK